MFDVTSMTDCATLGRFTTVLAENFPDGNEAQFDWSILSFIE